MRDHVYCRCGGRGGTLNCTDKVAIVICADWRSVRMPYLSGSFQGSRLGIVWSGFQGADKRGG